MNFNFGKMAVCWDDSYKGFNYKRHPITGEMADMWVSQGYTHTETSGLMYGSDNIMPLWATSCADILGYRNPAFSFYRMDQMNIMPKHSDHYSKYCELFDVNYEDVKRTVLFLEDWKSGHYFEIDNYGFASWGAGYYVTWQGDVPHSAANLGTQPRYTLQITGTT